MSFSEMDWHAYFEDNHNDWLDEAYNEADYTYPVGKHRLRVLNRMLSKYNLKQKKCLDIGCGGGDISFLLASKGAIVTGMDISENMLAIAEKRKRELDIDIGSKIVFVKTSFPEIPKSIENDEYDFIVAFGLIGYLESDDVFLETIDRVTKPGTVLFLSCRNRLFNISSVTSNTVEEIQNNSAVDLIQEIDMCYAKGLDVNKCHAFVEKLEDAIKNIKEEMDCWSFESKGNPGIQPGTGDKQPRSSTPKELDELCMKYGFVNMSRHGIHPHLFLPRMNKMLPPRVFNRISDALCIFEDDDVSLVYSSVYIGEYKKN